MQNLTKLHNYSDGNMFLRSRDDNNLVACTITLHATTYGDNVFSNFVSALKLPKTLRVSNQES